MDSVQWLRCGKLLDGTGQEPRSDMAVGLSGGHIHAVRGWNELSRAEQEGALDLSTSTVAPGFIDAHVHLLFTCDVDHDATRERFESSSTAELTIVGSRNAQEALLGGVTTVRDCGDTRYVVRGLRDAVRTGTLSGPRILTAGAPLTTTGGHLHWCGNAADSIEEIRKAVRTMCTEDVDFLKIMASGGAMTRESNVLQPQFEADELRVAVAEAHRFGRPVAAHSLNAESIRRGVAAGVDTLEHCYWRDDAGHYGDTSELIALLAPTNTSVVVTMAGIARALLSEREPGSPVEQAAASAASPTGALRSDYQWAREVWEAGINLVLASDAGVRFTPFRRFDETLRCGIEGLGVTPSQAVAMATANAARALGIQEVGIVAPGYVADLVVLDGTDVNDRLGTVRSVYRDGRLVVDDSRLFLPEPTDPARQ